MKQVLVTVFSETGNTMKIAEAIRDEATKLGFSVDLQPVISLELASLGDYDVVFIGSTCHSSNLAQPVLDLLAKLPESPAFKLAGFVTHSVWGSHDSSHLPLYNQWAGRCQPTLETACSDRGIDFLGFFSCMGAPAPRIEVFIRNTVITDEATFTEYLEEVRQHPNDKDLLNARAFAREVLERL